MHHPPFPAFTASEHGTAAPRPQANAPRPHAGAPGSAPDAPAPDAPAPDGPTPYAVGLIELAEGVRIVSNVIGVPYDKVRIGMPVRLEFLRVDEELELPVFRAAEGGEG